MMPEYRGKIKILIGTQGRIPLRPSVPPFLYSAAALVLKVIRLQGVISLRSGVSGFAVSRKMCTIGRKIRAERRSTGLTLEQLAKKAGISLITLERIETGKNRPSVVLLSEIAQHLGKSIHSSFAKR